MRMKLMLPLLAVGVILAFVFIFLVPELSAWATTLDQKQLNSYVVDSSSATTDPITGKFLVLLGGKGSDGLYHVVATDASGNLAAAGASTPGDSIANPTTAALSESFTMGWTGTVWTRIKADANQNMLVSLGTQLDGVNDTVSMRIANVIPSMPTAGADAVSNTYNGLDTNSFNMLWNGSSWDRLRSTGSNGSLKVGITDGSIITGYSQPGTNIEITGSNVKYCTSSNALTVGVYYEVQTDGRTHCNMVADNSGAVATTDPPYDSPGIYHRYVIDTSHDTLCCITTAATVIVDITPQTLVAQ